MKKLMLIMAVIVITATSVNAQLNNTKILFSIGVEPALPVGKFNDLGYNFGIGGSVQGELKVADLLGITLNAGYMNYSTKDITVNGLTVKGSSFGIIPVLAGAKVYATKMLYFHGQLGAGFGTSSGSGTDFAYSPGIGLMLSKNFDVLVKYVGYSANNTTLGSVGARIAYNF